MNDWLKGIIIGGLISIPVGLFAYCGMDGAWPRHGLSASAPSVKSNKTIEYVITNAVGQVVYTIERNEK
jgi:hypothetical protein